MLVMMRYPLNLRHLSTTVSSWYWRQWTWALPQVCILQIRWIRFWNKIKDYLGNNHLHVIRAVTKAGNWTATCRRLILFVFSVSMFPMKVAGLHAHRSPPPQALSNSPVSLYFNSCSTTHWHFLPSSLTILKILQKELPPLT